MRICRSTLNEWPREQAPVARHSFSGRFRGPALRGLRFSACVAHMHKKGGTEVPPLRQIQVRIAYLAFVLLAAASGSKKGSPSMKTVVLCTKLPP